MAQALPRYCPRCGTPTRADMQYCATCELPIEAMLSRPGNVQYNSSNYNEVAPQEAAVPAPWHAQQGNNEAHFTPMGRHSQDFQPGWNTPEDPAYAPQSSPISPFPGGNAPYHQGPQQSWSPQPPPWSAPAQSPESEPWNAGAPAQSPWNGQPQPSWNDQAQPPLPQAQPSRPRGKRRAGRVFLVLFIILALAGGGVFAYSAMGGHLPGLNASQATIKTTSLNSTITYAGASVTILNVEQAQNFVDDPHTASDGMVRLNLQEQNTTDVTIAWDYNQSAHLIVQGKPALTPTYVKSAGSIAPGATKKSTVDFAVPNGGSLSSLVFELGTSKEAQMQIPLNGQANLNQYQPKTTKQNGTVTYFGLNWNLTGATTSWNIAGQQASSGMEFLTLNVSIDNPLEQETISGSPFDYLRVKSGNQTSAPISTTIPVSFASGATGKQGTAIFLIPQNSSKCTLVMLSQDPGTDGQAKLNFQIG